jgi:hypothetical protein
VAASEGNISAQGSRPPPRQAKIIILEVWERYLVGCLKKEKDLFHSTGLGALHTMAKGWEAVNFCQSNCKKPRVWPFTLWPKSKGLRIFKMTTFWRRRRTLKEVSVGPEWRPKLWSRGRRFFSIKNQSSTRSWSLDWRGYFEQGIKWDAPLGLDFGLSLWKPSHYGCPSRETQRFGLWAWPFGGFTLNPADRKLQILYFIGYLFSTHFFELSLSKVWPLHSIPSHNLSTSTAIVWSGPQPWSQSTNK